MFWSKLFWRLSVIALSCHGEDAPKHFTLVPSLWSNMFSVSSVISLPIKLRETFGILCRNHFYLLFEACNKFQCYCFYAKEMPFKTNQIKFVCAKMFLETSLNMGHCQCFQAIAIRYCWNLMRKIALCPRSFRSNC